MKLLGLIIHPFFILNWSNLSKNKLNLKLAQNVVYLTPPNIYNSNWKSEIK